jgi:hypothetical protein
MNSGNCPICTSRLKGAELATNPATRTIPVNCPRCGQFAITFEALSSCKGVLGKRSLNWAIASHAIRRMTTVDRPHMVMLAWLQSVIDRETLPKPQEQADTMISLLGEESVASGGWIPYHPQALAGLLGTDDNPDDGATAGVTYVIDRLKDKKLIDQETPGSANDGTLGYRLTFDG